MKSLWTALFEADADWIAPKLSKCSPIAGAAYLWLMSRASQQGYAVRVSEVFLAKAIGVSRSGIRRAIAQLVDAGLVRQVTRLGNGGGSTFHMLGLSKLKGTGGSGGRAAYPYVPDGRQQMTTNASAGRQQMSKGKAITKSDINGKEKDPYDF